VKVTSHATHCAEGKSEMQKGHWEESFQTGARRLDLETQESQSRIKIAAG